MFKATTRDDADYEQDFFGKEAFLTVTGQLHVEAFAMAFRDVYTFWSGLPCGEFQHEPSCQ